MDGKSSSPLSPMSTCDFIDSTNLFDNSGDMSDGYKSMMDLEDVPSLKSFSKVLKMRTTYMAIIRSQKCLENQQRLRRGMIQCPNSYDDSEDDDSEVGDLSGEFLDGKGDRLVKDLGGDAFMRTFMCAMLANVGRVAEGVETTLYNSRASCHMTTYHD